MFSRGEEGAYLSIISKIVSEYGITRVLAVDLETLIRKQEDFLTGEQIIAASVAFVNESENIVKTEVFVSEGDGEPYEDQVLLSLDRFFAEFRPLIVIGYNHTGYDFPLLRIKMLRRSYNRQLWNLKYFLSTSYCPDMMYIIAYDLFRRTGDYKIRKLSDVVVHPEYSNLQLMRAKVRVTSLGVPVNEAIERLWREKSPDFIEYCKGDVHDILVILRSLLSL
ncbi:MAG: hypothetical protein QXV22_01360 [Thermoplasmataceae archaeon]